MPQQPMSVDEFLAAEEEEKKKKEVPVAAKPAEKNKLEQLVDLMKQGMSPPPLRDVIGTTAGALGGMRGGVPGAVLGGGMGYLGAKMSPETVPEQAVTSLVTGPLGPAARTTGEILKKALQTGAAAGLTTGIRTGDPEKAALSAGTTSGMQGLLEFLGPLLPQAYGAARKGAVSATEKLAEKFGGFFGQPPPITSGANNNALPVYDLVRSIITSKGKVFAGGQVITPELMHAAEAVANNPAQMENFGQKIFSSAVLTEDFTKVAKPKQVASLFSQFAKNTFAPDKFFIRTKGVPTGPETDAMIFQAGESWRAVKKFMQSPAFEKLPSDLQDATVAYGKVAQVLDPSEALVAIEKTGRGLEKVGTFSLMRAFAGMRGAGLGAIGGVLGNLASRVTNPEVRKMIMDASAGKQEAVQALGRLAALWASNPPEQQLNDLP